VAPQALYMMNSEFVAARTRSLAEQLLADSALDDTGRVRRAYYRALGKPPDEGEIRAALDYIAHFPQGPGPAAWSSFCRTLAASNDFLYVY